MAAKQQNFITGLFEQTVAQALASNHDELSELLACTAMCQKNNLVSKYIYMFIMFKGIKMEKLGCYLKHNFW